MDEKMMSSTEMIATAEKVPCLRFLNVYDMRNLIERNALKILMSLINRNTRPGRSASMVGMLEIKSIQPHFMKGSLFFARRNRIKKSIRKTTQIPLSMSVNRFDVSAGSTRIVSRWVFCAKGVGTRLRRVLMSGMMNASVDDARRVYAHSRTCPRHVPTNMFAGLDASRLKPSAQQDSFGECSLRVYAIVGSRIDLLVCRLHLRGIPNNPFKQLRPGGGDE